MAVLVLTASDTPASDIGRYGLYWAIGLTLPGILVWRAFVGSRGNWAEDAAAGAVTGFGLELIAWAAWSSLGLQPWLWLWPAAVLATFAAVPALRRHWRIAEPRPLPVVWSWSVVVSIALAFGWLSHAYLSQWALPPDGTAYYGDLLWHLSIVHELSREFPPETPQVVGEPFRYHWFSHAHMASAHLVSGVPEATVLLRLWLLPVVAVTAVAAASLAREVSRVWWAGPVAALAVVVLSGINLLPVHGFSMYTVVPLSPSHVFIVPIVLVAAFLIVRLLRGEEHRWTWWLVLGLVVILAAGAKPTGLPLLCCASMVSCLVLLVMRRREWRSAAAITALTGAVFLLARAFVAGSDNSAWTNVSLFGYFMWLPIYQDLTGDESLPLSGDLVPAGVSDLSMRSIGVMALLLAIMICGHAGRLVPFLLLSTRAFRRDPAAWWFAGFVAGGWGVFLTFSHVALSQAYFLNLTVPIAGVFLAWALTWAMPRSTSRLIKLMTLTLGVAAGGVVVWLARRVTPVLEPEEATSLAARAVSFAAPIAVVAAALFVGWLGWAVARRLSPAIAGAGVAVLVAAVGIGAQLESAARYAQEALERVISGGEVAASGAPVSVGLATALTWLEENSDENDVVATNLHCSQVKTIPGCDARGFSVSGLGGRRTVLEGWGYTGEVSMFTSPPPWPDRFALNEKAFSDPSADVLRRLRDQYGVRWLVASTEAGPVAPELERLALKRFSSGAATVYELG